MDPDQRALFISLRPRFAELLLEGSKTVELRRVQPAVARGARALLYAASPVQALVGAAVIQDVHVATRAQIWKLHGARTGITREEYEQYFSEASIAVAITLAEVQRLQTPVTLAELRQGREWFRPPQSFRYLDAEQVASLTLPQDPPAAVSLHGRVAKQRYRLAPAT
jgi:predicted transcriptional regulator